MNSQANVMLSPPVQACCLPVTASPRPELLHPVPAPGQALAAFIQASGVLARSLVAFALTSARQGMACVNRQSLPGQAMQILPAAPLVLARSSRATLVCEKGMLWITQGDGHDYILKAGQRLALAPRDQVVVKAMRGPAWMRCLDGSSAS